MAFDYKKEYKEFYFPPRTPGIVTVPSMNFLAVRGQGDPNEEGGAYKQALELLYAVAYASRTRALRNSLPRIPSILRAGGRSTTAAKKSNCGLMNGTAGAP